LVPAGKPYPEQLYDIYRVAYGSVLAPTVSAASDKVFTWLKGNVNPWKLWKVVASAFGFPQIAALADTAESLKKKK
jgi:hypothetical protein